MVSLRKIKIMCVHDSEDESELFPFMLTLMGCDVESTQSMTNALSLLEHSLFDLCLFNISLRNGTGFKWLEKVRAIAPSIPLIICSDDASELTRQQAMQVGIHAFFTKPVDFNLLITAITQPNKYSYV